MGLITETTSLPPVALAEQTPVVDRFAKQADLVPAKALKSLRVTVVGVGAVGRQVAIQLAAIGVPRLQLIDFDEVDDSNITSQGYLKRDVGELKVKVMEGLLKTMDDNLQVEVVPDVFSIKHQPSPVMFCCVDSIRVREEIWNAVKKRSQFFCDGRMLGEIMRVLVVADGVYADHYEQQFFAEAEAEQGRCTARGTIYTAGVAAGLMLHQFTRWLRNMPVDRDFMLNLMSGELIQT